MPALLIKRKQIKTLSLSNEKTDNRIEFITLTVISEKAQDKTRITSLPQRGKGRVLGKTKRKHVYNTLLNNHHLPPLKARSLIFILLLLVLDELRWQTIQFTIYCDDTRSNKFFYSSRYKMISSAISRRTDVYLSVAHTRSLHLHDFLMGRGFLDVCLASVDHVHLIKSRVVWRRADSRVDCSIGTISARSCYLQQE